LTRVVLSLALCFSLVGCAPEAPGEAPTESASQGIVNGQLDNGDPAVVALAVDGYLVCSGTLITPTVVLTAAHCTPPTTGSSFTDIAVFFGNDVTQSGELIQVIDGWSHPSFSLDEADYDIAVLRLARPGPAAPIQVNTIAMSNADVGDPVRIVGFGMTSENNPNSAGRKRQGTTVVYEVFPGLFTMPLQPSGTCSGDSGGTALMVRGGNEVVTGVHSRSDCASIAIDTRVDAFLDDINAFIGAVEPGCGFDGACASGCSEPDPDCPCAPDGLCTSACADPATDPDCDPSCGADGTCSESCPMPDPDCGQCAADGTCMPGCASDPDCLTSGCPADGICDASCEDDPDCWVAGDAEPTDLQVDSGCHLAPSRHLAHGRSGRTGPWLALLAAAALLRRRSRVSA
jgi:hypothetical protein